MNLSDGARGCGIPWTDPQLAHPFRPPLVSVLVDGYRRSTLTEQRVEFSCYALRSLLGDLLLLLGPGLALSWEVQHVADVGGGHGHG